MWPIKTREEIHREYMKEINKLKYEVGEMKCDMDMTQRKIGAHNHRIKQLEETAKMFSPQEGLN